MSKQYDPHKDRIVFLLDSLKSIGGAELMFIEQANYFQSQGVPTYFAVCHSQKRDNDFSGKLELGKPVAYFFFKNILDLKSYWQFSRYIKKNRIKILYPYLDYSNIIGRIMKIFNPGLRVVIVEPGDPFRKKPWMRKLDWWLNFGVYKIFAMSETIADSLKGYLKIHRHKILGMRNGVHQILTNEQITAKVQMAKQKKDFTLLHIGNMQTENKGHHGLIEMLREIFEQQPQAKIKMVFIGDGHMKPELISLVEKYHLTDKVIFTGWIDRPAVKEYFNQTDVFVFNSRNEGGAASIMEATSAAVPTVSSDFSSVKEVVIDGVTGWVVKRDDAKAFAKHVLQLYQDRDLLVKMGQAAFQLYQEKFTYAKLADEFIKEIYS